MKKQLLPFLLLALLPCLSSAQPQPCGPNPEMTSFCNEACIICDINGFTGINDDPQTGQAPPGFCTSFVHHMQWIGFIAGSENLQLEIKVFNCTGGDGLEVGIYKSLNCTSFQQVSNCDTDIPNNTTGVLTNTVPLTIGQYYYLVMDGSNDDVCKYTITVKQGTTAVGVLETSGVISGDATVCPGRNATYAVAAPEGAAAFEWTLDGVTIANGADTTVNIDWAGVGAHNLCVTAYNVCDTAPPVCYTVHVEAIPATYIFATICAGDCWQAVDSLLCDSGDYTFVFTGQEECDSTVIISVFELPVSETGLDLLICAGDTVYVGGKPFFQTGQYQEVLQNVYGCDSIVTLDLQVIVCEIQGVLIPESVDCNGQPTGALRFLIDDGTPPFQYSWERIGPGTPSGSGNIAALQNEILIPGLSVGTYFITISDNFGHNLILFDDITEPLPLTGIITPSDYHGVGISCAGGQDGVLTLTPAGGKNPYSFQWNTGAQSSVLPNLGAGAYTVTITDANDCTQTLTATLSEPTALQLETAFVQPGCAGLNTGAGAVTLAAGGIEPYTFDLSNSGFDSVRSFSSLFPGNYTLTLRDANGCTATTDAYLETPLIPEIELGPDLTVELGESIRLSLTQNLASDTFIWMPPTGLSCTDCAEPQAGPYFTTTYTLEVVAPGGCRDTDFVQVQVIAVRDVYIPNAFSPNDDGENDFFTVFGGPEVAQVRRLEVWSRWGELVYSAENVEANNLSGGWDGRFRGRTLPPGVFTWTAEVVFLDGVALRYSGNVTLVQ